MELENEFILAQKKAVEIVNKFPDDVKLLLYGYYKHPIRYHNYFSKLPSFITSIAFKKSGFIWLYI